MNILLVMNKTYPRGGKQEEDMGVVYVQQPLEELGHAVYFYDTVNPTEPDLDKVVASFEPDLIYCCVTGNPHITPFEPWDKLPKYTASKEIVTFNWFCDDTWRFNNFSKGICRLFNYCSTPEPGYVNKYREAGYENIVLATWMVNEKAYPEIPFTEKEAVLYFVGGIDPNRAAVLHNCGIPIKIGQGLSLQELFKFHAQNRVGLNLSKNSNDPEGKTQMKQRVFEITAAGSVALTEYHEGLLSFFEEGEIVTFKTTEELVVKGQELLANPDKAEAVARAGRERFLKEHTSKIRLSKLLEEIMS